MSDDAAPMSARAAARDAAIRLSDGLGLAAASRAVRRGGAPVRVMVLHGTPARDGDALRAQVRWVRDHLGLLDPAEYLEILDGTRPPPRRPAVVFSFDDGLASNAAVAASILEDAGTRGLFFVCPSFAPLTGDAALRFFVERVRYLDDPARLGPEDYLPMDPATLRALHRRGHVIGNHTASHQDLRFATGTALAAEIDGARATLAGWLAAEVTCFAWTFAWNAITAAAWAAALAGHRHCFTACAGNGDDGPGCVWRTNVEPAVPDHVYRFFYSGLGDPIWWSRRRRVAALHRRAEALAR